MDRRSFLKKGLLGGALLTLGGAGLALVPTRHLATPRGPLFVLDDRGFQVLVAVSARVLPLPDVDHIAIAHGIDTALSRVAPESKVDLVRLLGLFENALPGLLLDGRATPFTRLAPASQDRVLASWRDSRITLRRGGYHALRKLCLGVHYGDVRSWPSIRYNGPPDMGGFFHDDSKAGTPDSPPAVRDTHPADRPGAVRDIPAAEAQKGGAP